jgi:uncharacterized protein YdhG (YjbR/CyaY superfamily)
MKKTEFKDVDSYIDTFPKDTQELLEKIRTTIRKAAPKAEEVISYQMPAYKLEGVLVYFAGYKQHIGFYPMPSALREFKKELSIYKGSKGAVQFPLDKPLPLTLITKMVKFRVSENKKKAKEKKKRTSMPKDSKG